MKTRIKHALFGASLTALLLASAQAEPGVTKDTIKLGMFGPLTGAVSIYGYPINNGAIAIYRAINDQGGINGRKIEIVHEDGACDPAKTRAAVKKLIHRDEVFAIHGGSCSAAVVAAKPEFVENKVPMMVMAATLDAISDPPNRYVFTTTLPGSGDGVTMINFAKSMPNVKRIAVIKHANEWAEAKAKAIYAMYKSAGFELVAEVVLESKANDATSQVLKLREAKPDVTMFLLYPGESAVFLRDAQKYGLGGQFLGTTAVMDLVDLAQRSGSAAALKNVHVGAFLLGPIDSPEMKQYADLYAKYFPKDKLQSLSFYGMSGALTVIDALKRAGPNLTREKFVDALEATRDGNAGPGYCKVNFGPDKRQGCTAGTMWALRDGKIVNVGETYKPN
jgi:branched-chain amino acid transport system substrate-binding protein